MQLRSLVMILASALPMMAAGKLPVPNRMAAPPPVCSIPLLEVPHRSDARSRDTMPRLPATSLDHNQIPPPAPPCTADNRYRPKRQAPHFQAPRAPER
jgi:hypothetical protein